MDQKELEDIDPFFIDSWVDFCQWCISLNRLDLFKKYISTYIEITNRPILKDLNEYIIRLEAEKWKDTEGEKERKRTKSYKTESL